MNKKPKTISFYTVPPDCLKDKPVFSIEYDDNSGIYPIRNIFQQFGETVLNDPTLFLSDEQRRAIIDIANCKTGECGFTAAYCPSCKHVRIHNASCGNRACPNCQQMEEKIWVENRAAETIEGIAYYHIVLTLPSELYPLALANQSFIYPLLLTASSQAVIQLAEDLKHGGFTPGVIATLHTWKSDMGVHPHAHLLVTGGGLTETGQFIEGPHKGFFVHQDVLADVFRGKFMEALNERYIASFNDPSLLSIPSPKAMGGFDLTDPLQWKNFCSMLYSKSWIAHINETFNGHGNAIRYLGRYVYRTAISNARVVSFRVDDDHPEGEVVYKWKDYNDNNQWKLKTVTGIEFIKLFVVHVLPKGLCRVRYFGLLSNSRKKRCLEKIAKLRNTIFAFSIFKDMKRSQAVAYILKKDICTCPKCRGKLASVGKIYREEVMLA